MGPGGLAGLGIRALLPKDNPLEKTGSNTRRKKWATELVKGIPWDLSGASSTSAKCREHILQWDRTFARTWEHSYLQVTKSCGITESECIIIIL